MSLVNYAHRGASEYAPENTMCAFEMGVAMGATGIETDVQLTKDSVPVLFHDAKLERMTGEAGSVSDYTYDELQAFRVRKDGMEDRIPTLKEFLERFAGKGLRLAIELKQKSTAEPTVKLIAEHGAQRDAVITSFDYDELLIAHRSAPELECGYLAKEVDDQLLMRMKADGICELCPPADMITAENVRQWKAEGFRVRAWAVKSEQLMRRACEAGVDGMTVNFPDKLTELCKNQ